MRTLIIPVCGFVLWGGCLGVIRLLGDSGTSKMSLATYVFIALWFLVAAGNIWVGVTKAGYSVKEELPIFLLIFLALSLLRSSLNGSSSNRMAVEELWGKTD